MTRQAISTFFMAATACAALSFQGCSLLGYVIGAESRPAREGGTTSTLGLESVEMGTRIRLHKYDQTTVEGSYRGHTTYPGKMYALWFDTLVARSAYKGFVPKLNQRITLRSAGRDDIGYFRGIERGGILFQALAGKDTAIVALDEFEWTQDSDSSRLDSRTVRKLVRNGSIPGRQLILLQNQQGEELIPYETVENVEVLPRKSGGWAGFLVGAIPDALILIGLATMEPLCH